MTEPEHHHRRPPHRHPGRPATIPFDDDEFDRGTERLFADLWPSRRTWAAVIAWIGLLVVVGLTALGVLGWALISIVNWITAQ